MRLDNARQITGLCQCALELVVVSLGNFFLLFLLPCLLVVKRRNWPLHDLSLSLEVNLDPPSSDCDRVRGARSLRLRS